MKKSLLIFFIFFVIRMVLTSQIVITEFMYNPPESADTNEFVELYNNSDQAVEMLDWQLSGASFKFPSYQFQPHAYIILSKGSTYISKYPSVKCFIWTGTNNGLSNSGEAIKLQDKNGNIIDELTYAPSGGWDPLANGSGASLELCDVNAPNGDFNNWKASTFKSGIISNGIEMLCTPGAANSVICTPTTIDYTKLTINEIMYNDGGNTDSLEFVEIYNNSKDSISLSGCVFKSRFVNYPFPQKKIAPWGYFVICGNANSFKSHFGFQAESWVTGGLNNKTDTLMLFGPASEKLDQVIYLEDGDWSNLADGGGYSLTLCNPDYDNSLGKSWQAAITPKPIQYNGKTIYSSPAKANYCSFDYSYIKEVDDQGLLKHLKIHPYIEGNVYGVNFNSTGLQFVLMDDNKSGLWIYGSKNYGYNVFEGDIARVYGNMEQFSGLTQLVLDTIIAVNHDDALIDPKVVTKFTEADEGNLVNIKNVHIVNYSEWLNSGSAFNVNVSDGTETFALRIDDNCNIFGKQAPSGTFSVTGLLGQYDKTAPLLDGYQLYPRYTSDIDPYSFDTYPLKKIGEVTQVDNNGVAVSSGLSCELRGVVYGINIRPSGLQFAMIDNENNGIAIFSSSRQFGYQVTEGDLLTVRGKVSQFNGLIQFVPDTLIFVSSSNQLFAPTLVTKLDESTESQLVKIENLTLKDPTKWTGNGQSLSIIVTNGTTEFNMFIDNDCELSTAPVPDYKFNLIGLGNQYDKTSPFTDGYEISPRYAADLQKVSATHDEDFKTTIYPNPAGNSVNILSDIDIKDIQIYDVNGILKINSVKKNIDISNLTSGFYIIKINSLNSSSIGRLMKL